MLTARQKEYIKNLPIETAEKPVAIFPWEEKGMEIAQSVIDDIHTQEPGLEIFLRGSVPLKIAGQRDIDLTSVDDCSNFAVHILKLEKVLGKVSKVNEHSIVWHFLKEGYAVGFYIVDPKKSDQLQRQTDTDNLFKNNPSLLEEYQQLKISLNGVPYKIYQEKKYEFFNKFGNFGVK